MTTHDLSRPSHPRQAATSVAVAGAMTVLLGTLLTTFGLSFDIQWHVDVGPDTFFTLSHLMLYAGSALAGLASLAVVLYATAMQRRGTPVPRSFGGPPIRVFGALFSAPLGYLVAGAGAALFLLYGLVDLWWHGIYGFDAVLNSPPHIALFLSVTVTMVGSIIVCAAARDRFWGRAGLVLSACVLMCFAPITTEAFDGLALPIEPGLAGLVLTSVTMLVAIALILGRPGGALAVAVVFGVLQWTLWPYSLWAARAYAAASGLPLRDGLTGEPPVLPASMPAFLLLAALIIELAVAASRRAGRIRARTFVVPGAAAGTTLGVTILLQGTLFDPTETVPLVLYGLAAATGALFGALSGYLGARLAVILLHGRAPIPAPPTAALIPEGRTA